MPCPNAPPAQSRHQTRGFFCFFLPYRFKSEYFASATLCARAATFAAVRPRGFTHRPATAYPHFEHRPSPVSRFFITLCHDRSITSALHEGHTVFAPSL